MKNVLCVAIFLIGILIILNIMNPDKLSKQRFGYKFY